MPTSARVRNRLARIGGSRAGSVDVLDPLIKVYRATHPKGEIAAIQDVPLGTAKSWIRRGLTALRGCLS